jgi:hypothetical protein
MEPADLARAFGELADWAAKSAPVPEPAMRRRLREHLNAEPSGLPVVAAEILPFDRPNFQVAIDSYLATADRRTELVGLSVMHGYRMGIAELAQAGSMHGPPVPNPGSVEYESVAIGSREVLCVKSGVWLVRHGDERLAVMLKQTDHGPMGEMLLLEVMATERAVAERAVAELRELMDTLNVYRGKILTLSPSRRGTMSLSVASLPQVRRDQIVLPTGVLERIERHTIGFAERAEALRHAGRHLKRGLLLHGPPGTGKTLTAMYLSTQMPGRTVLLLTGHALHFIDQTAQLARSLAPSMVVLEDVDLVASERGPRPDNPVLFSLLNAMDGLAEDSDVIFVLTTNRPDVLEPALASRPGRIDQAVELPYPDAEGRARLIELYGTGLRLEVENVETFVEQTDGTSPAFIRELLRRAALGAPIASDGTLRVTDRELQWALDDLRLPSGALTLTFLGSRTPAGSGLPPGTWESPGPSTRPPQRL